MGVENVILLCLHGGEEKDYSFWEIWEGRKNDRQLLHYLQNWEINFVRIVTWYQRQTKW